MVKIIKMEDKNYFMLVIFIIYSIAFITAIVTTYVIIESLEDPKNCICLEESEDYITYGDRVRVSKSIAEGYENEDYIPRASIFNERKGNSD